MKNYSKQVREYIKSTLFNSYYIEKGFIESYQDDWAPWESEEYNAFYHGVKAYIKKKDQTFFTKIQPSETTTIDKYILPIMTLLGWDEFQFNSSVKTVRETAFQYGDSIYKPDILYFANEEKVSKVDNLKKKKDEQKKYVENNLEILLEAKRFGLLKLGIQEKDNKSDSTVGRSPEEQTVTYMEMLRSQYGILSDGGVWKFFCDDFRDKNKYFSFDFGKLALLLLNSDENDLDKNEEFDFFVTFFYSIFSKEGLKGNLKRVDHLISYSKKYSEHLQDKMQDRFILAMNHACNGLAKSIKLMGENPEDYLDLIKTTAESHLFNIIFFRSLESRGVLPYYDQDNDYAKISISKTVDEIYSNNFDPAQNFEKQLNLFSEYFQEKVEKGTTKICVRLMQLYEKVNSGYKEFKISGFKESVFIDEEWAFAKKFKIDDQHMMSIFFFLSLVPKNSNETEFQLIPYDYLTPRELGSIYESFLEFKIIKSSNDLFWDSKSKSWKNFGDKVKFLKSTEMIKKNDYYFSPDNSDRKMTGSYYTPENVVKFIVKNALGPLCENKMPNEILKIKIIDPAMGSGHFLSASLDFLTSQYLESFRITNAKIIPTYEQAIRAVLDSCIHGTDINPSAIKLGKMSLWLLTAYADVKLEKLEDQIKLADALSGNCKSNFKKIFAQNGFDVVLGNPPYGAILKKEQLRSVELRYQSFIPNRDIYSAFVEEGFSMLKQGGTLSFIIPSLWLANNHFKNLREFFLKYSIDYVLTMPDKVFKDAIIDTLIFQAKNELCTDNKVKVRVLPKKFDLNDLLQPVKFNHISKKQWVIRDDFSIILGGEALRLIDRLRKDSNNVLENIVECKRGVLANCGMTKSSKSTESDYRLFDGSVDRYSLNTELSGWLTFGPKLKECPKDEKWFKNERLLLRRVMGKSNRLIAMHTERKFITSKNYYSILPKNNVDILFIMAIINSKLLSYLYRNLNPQANKVVFPQITVGDFYSLPLPKEIDKKSKDYKSIINLVGKAISANMISEELDTKIDELVFNIYNLSKKEIEEVENFFVEDKKITKKKAA